jgi:hypothetical protein
VARLVRACRGQHICSLRAATDGVARDLCTRGIAASRRASLSGWLWLPPAGLSRSDRRAEQVHILKANNIGQRSIAQKDFRFTLLVGGSPLGSTLAESDHDLNSDCEDVVLTNEYLEFILEQAGYEVVALKEMIAEAIGEQRNALGLTMTNG